MWRVSEVSFHSWNGSAGQIFFDSMPAIWQGFPLTAIEEIGKGAAHSLEHPARVIPRFVEELFDFPLHDILVGILIFIRARLLDSIALILDLVHVPPLIHPLDARCQYCVVPPLRGVNLLPRSVFPGK